MSKKRTVELRRRIEGLLRNGQTLESLAAEPAPAHLAQSVGRKPRRQVDRTAVLEKISQDLSLTRSEDFFAQSILLPELRPVFDVVGGDYAPVMEREWQVLNEAPVKRLVKSVAGAAGSVEVTRFGVRRPIGTCFLVAPRLAMTNNHVAIDFAFPVGLGKGALRPDTEEAGIDFLRENGRDESSYVAITGVEMMHPYWDMALLRLAETPEGVSPPDLATDPSDARAGSEAVVIGFPAFDNEEDAALQDRVMREVYSVKRVQPGVLGDTLVHDPSTSALKHIHFGVRCVGHDSSTLSGNSGSAVVSLTTGRVVGLHFFGVFRSLNWAIPMADIACDRRVLDAGLNFAGAPVGNAGPWDRYWNVR